MFVCFRAHMVCRCKVHCTSYWPKIMDTQCCNADPHVHCLSSAQSVACCNGTGNWYPFAIENDEWKAIFELESTSSVPEKFKPIPSTLRAFLQFLESHAQINVSIPKNKIVRVAGVAGDAVVHCALTQLSRTSCVCTRSRKSLPKQPAVQSHRSTTTWGRWSIPTWSRSLITSRYSAR